MFFWLFVVLVACSEMKMLQVSEEEQARSLTHHRFDCRQNEERESAVFRHDRNILGDYKPFDSKTLTL